VKELHDVLLQSTVAVLQNDADLDSALNTLVNMIKGSTPNFHWVGFYLVDPEGFRELELGPFAGEPTEHKRIEFGRGICGQAADRKETFLVQDVSQEDNYLACGLDVKSEIVVPIIKDGNLLGELDIDSNQKDAFTVDDQEFLEQICSQIAKYWNRFHPDSGE